jgi:hypothetical protein
LIGIGRCAFDTVGDRRSDSLYTLRNGIDGSANQIGDTLGNAGLFGFAGFGRLFFIVHAISPKTSQLS